MRLLPYRVEAGAWNMAADEVLLTSALTSGEPILRFYAWTEATLSLGYFQPHAPARAVPELSPLAWVRRPSGGLALVHHHEVTYALALPPGSQWQPRGESWLVRMHEVIRDALANLGVESRLCEVPQTHGEVLCFLSHTPGDIVIGNHKVVGSAQRKQYGTVMQHGSILLGQSPHTPALPGIAELSGMNLSGEELISEVETAFERRLSWGMTPAMWTTEEHQRIAEVEETRYRSAAWNERR